MGKQSKTRVQPVCPEQDVTTTSNIAGPENVRYVDVMHHYTYNVYLCVYMYIVVCIQYIVTLLLYSLCSEVPCGSCSVYFLHRGCESVPL